MLFYNIKLLYVTIYTLTIVIIFKQPKLAEPLSYFPVLVVFCYIMAGLLIKYYVLGLFRT